MPVVMKRCRKMNTTTTRDHGNDGHCQDEVPLHIELTGIDAQAHLQRVKLFAGQNDQRPEEVIPPPNDRENCKHCECRRGQWQDDAPIDLPLGRLIHTCGIDELIRDSQHILAQYENPGGRRYRW